MRLGRRGSTDGGRQEHEDEKGHSSVPPCRSERGAAVVGLSSAAGAWADQGGPGEGAGAVEEVRGARLTRGGDAELDWMDLMDGMDDTARAPDDVVLLAAAARLADSVEALCEAAFALEGGGLGGELAIEQGNCHANEHEGRVGGEGSAGGACGRHGLDGR